MISFEETYQRLRQSGQLGWAGEHHERSVRMDRQRLQQLAAEGYFPLPRGRAIELGCGNGVALFALAELGFEAFGIEISQTATEWARERAEEQSVNARVICGSVTEMQVFPDAYFQLAYDGACLHCLLGDDRGKALDEIFRVLRPGGIFVLSSMCGTPRKLPDRQRFDPDRGVITDEDGIALRRILPRHEIEDELVCMGFSVLSGTVSENAWWDHLSLIVQRPEVNLNRELIQTLDKGIAPA